MWMVTRGHFIAIKFFSGGGGKGQGMGARYPPASALASPMQTLQASVQT